MTMEPPSWKYTGVNSATLQMCGTEKEEEFISLEPWELAPEKQPDGELSQKKAKRKIEKAMKEGSHYFEWTHKRHGGEEFYATVLLTKVATPQKEFLLATVRDITKQKQADEVTQSRAKELAKMNELMVGRELQMISLKEKIKKLEKILNIKKKK